MTNLRPILFMGLLVISYLMWVEWQKDYGPQPPAPQQLDEVIDPPVTLDTPDMSDIPGEATPEAGDLPSVEPVASENTQQVGSQAEMLGVSELVRVTTDVLEVEIDLQGAAQVRKQMPECLSIFIIPP